jgi:hypothetical protein
VLVAAGFALQLILGVVQSFAADALKETARAVRREPTAPVMRGDAGLPAENEIVRVAGSELDSEHPSKTLIHRAEGGAAAFTPGSGGRGSMLWLVLFGLICAGGVVSMWSKRRPGMAAGSLPANVFQILGRAPAGPGTTAMVARFGEQLLLLSSTQAGLSTLAVVDDPAEVSRLMAECLAASSKPSMPLRRPVNKAASLSVVGTAENFAAPMTTAPRPVLQRTVAPYSEERRHG